ncbi:hypothetical protein ABW19_dt0206343 [Dactylella cylindrospora]|nr:hypothetical protein ABW19_dt0206343 [Dactylella cylindrospora]
MSSSWQPVKSEDDDYSPTRALRHFSTGSLSMPDPEVPTPPPPEPVKGGDVIESKKRLGSGAWTLPENSGSGIVSDFQTLYGKGSNDGGVWVHSSTKQLHKLLYQITLRVIGSAVFVGLIILLFVLYARFAVMDTRHKYTFNSLSVLLFLLFGIHLLLAFKELAEMARWRVLASGAHKLKDVDLILGLGSLRSTIKLGLRSLSHGTPGTRWVLKASIAFGWVGLLCLLNVAIALLGLTYSVDDADDLGLRPGQVSIANLKRFFPNNDTNGFDGMTAEGGQLGTEQFMANLYGITSFSYKKGNASDDHAKDEYWLEQYNNGSWKYHFHDLNYYGGLNTRTDRFITTNQTCKSWKIENITDDWQTFWYWKPENNEFQSKTLQELLPNFTTYAIQPEPLCDRCREIDVVQLTSAAQAWTNETTEEVGYYYYCRMEVGPVINAKIDNHILNDREAQIAAGAIGSRGWVNGRYSYITL